MLLEALNHLVARLLGLKPPFDEDPSFPKPQNDSTSRAGGTTQQSRWASVDVDEPTSSSVTTSQYEDRFPPASNDGAGLFRYAHDFVIKNPVFIAQAMNSGGIGLQPLLEKRMVGAEVDASARRYCPRCHPETRTTIRGRIVDWVDRKRDRGWRMLWVMGPAGVGKSAVAQTIAEQMKAEGRLGASLFFSRQDGRSDPDKVIPTLVYQLAVRLPHYKHIVTQRLAEDSTLLEEKSLRAQFKELIADPLHLIMTEHPSAVSKPLLMVLDGLDECSSQEAQCEFIELISDLARIEDCPLLWLVCSRPEWHLKHLISHPDFPTTCKREELKIDDSEAQRDVVRFLRDEFADICRRFPDYITTRWPPEVTLRLIATVASGLFALAITITRFVGDEIADDPCTQLQICVRFLGGFGVPGAINPLHALDLLYTQICMNIPDTILATTKQVLGLSTYYPHGASDSPLSAQCLANFLHLTQAEFYRSLKQLHSVVIIPSSSEAHTTSLRFYHTSFQDYLKDPSRSHKFAINEAGIHYSVAEQAIQWEKNRTEEAFSWPSDDKDSCDKLFLSLNNYAAHVVLRACPNPAVIHILSIAEKLEFFNFRTLDSSAEGLPAFICWLYSLPYLERLVHTRTHSCESTHFYPSKIFRCSKHELEEFQQMLTALKVKAGEVGDHLESGWFRFDLGGTLDSYMVNVALAPYDRYQKNSRHYLNTVCSRQRWSLVEGEIRGSGPQETRVWTVDIFVNRIPYMGHGPSKAKAYEAAAWSALNDLKNKVPDAVPDEFL